MEAPGEMSPGGINDDKDELEPKSHLSPEQEEKDKLCNRALRFQLTNKNKYNHHSPRLLTSSL